jgi:hypothetical protein
VLLLAGALSTVQRGLERQPSAAGGSGVKFISFRRTIDKLEQCRVVLKTARKALFVNYFESQTVVVVVAEHR